MILICENCKSAFLVPASHFAQGPRQVRCGKCKHVWTASFAAPAKAPPPPAKAEKKRPPAAKPAPRPDWRARGLTLLASLAAGIGLTGVLALIFVLLHEPIVRHWPETQATYLALGFAKPPETDKLYLVDIRSTRRYQDGAMQLVIEGSIRSGSKKTQTIPQLAAEALDESGHVIQSWRIAPPQAKVGPEMTVSFTSAILSPEGPVAEINLSFAEQPRDDEHESR